MSLEEPSPSAERPPKPGKESALNSKSLKIVTKLDKFSKERIIEIGMGVVPVSRTVPEVFFGFLLVRNEVVDVDCILKGANSELIG